MKKILLFFIVLLSIFGLRGYAQIGYKFTGSQNHIVTSGDLSNYISNRNALTVEFWAKPSANSDLLFSSIYVPGSAGQTELGGFGLYQNTLIVSIGSDFMGFSQSVDLGNRLSTVGWHHFAYVYNGVEWIFYVDGALISSNPDQEGLSGATPNYSGSGLTQFKIGGLSDGSTVIGALDYFDGSMDDFRVWNTARTQTQISSNRTIELTGSETGLILYYKLNEQSGQVVSNSTALSLNGVRGVTSGTETRDPAINQVGIVTGPPVTTTTAATNIAGSVATLNGTVNDNGANSTVSFDYSTNATLGSGVITVNATTGGTVNVGSGNTSASVALSGLTGSTTYYYRVKASNSGGSTIGNILSFTTGASTASPVVIVPANGSFVSTTTPTYGGTAPAGSTIRVYVDGTVLGNTVTANSAGNWAITQPTALAQGSHTVYATAQSSGNAVSANSSTNTFTVDSLRPSMVISSTAGPSGGSTGSSPIPFTVTFSESVTGFVAGDITPINVTISGFSGSGTTYTFNATPIANGVVTINIPANVAQDAAGNGNTAAIPFSITYTQMTTASPVVIVPANGGFVSTPTPTYGGTAPAGSTITVYVDGTALGTTTANSAGNWAITHPTALAQGYHTVYATAQSSGNAVSANSPTNTFTVDSLRPSLVISSPAGASAGSTGTSPIPFTVTFSESVTGFVAGDLTPGNATISGFSGSGTTYTFNATPTANGVVTMNIAANVSLDAAGNGNTAATPFSITYAQVVTASPFVIVPANGSFVSTPTPTYAGTAPAGSTITVYVDGVGLGTTTANSAGNWAIIQQTALAQGLHTVYATAQSSGNAVSANSNTNTFTVDSLRPSLVISSTAGPSGGSTVSSPIPFTVSFSESVTGFVAGDLTPGNATISGFSGSGTTYTFNATPIANGAVTMNIPANVAQDASGNGNTAGSQFSINYIVQAPVVTTSGGSTAFTGSTVPIDNGLTVTDADNTTLSYASVTITSNFIAGEDTLFFINNSSALYGNITGSYNAGTGVLTLTSSGATATIAQWQAALRAVAYGNAASSPNTAARTISFTVNDGTANSTMAAKNVTVINQATVTSIVRAASNPTNAAAVTYTVTFNKPVTGISTSNFSITTSGTINGISPSISGSGTTYTVTINTGTGSGTIRLNLANSNGISPSAITNLPFIGETYNVDKIAPSVTSVAVPANATYTASENLDFTVNFSEAVTVDTTVNTPFIAVTLSTGGTVRANYISGSGTNALVYRYTVASTDRDFDGIVLGALNINGASIRDATSNNANTTLNNVGSTTGVLVDGTPNTSQTITFNTLPVKTYGDADFDSGATSNNSGIPITYASSNTNVATIVNGKIHVIAVGSSTITASQPGDGSHNAATDVQQTLTVNAKAITVTAGAKSKTYGNADPALTYTFAPALVAGDSFSGSLTRTAGENVGTYAINQGTLALNSNYTVTYVGADFTIGAKPITVTADAKSKTYGDDDPALTYTFAPALVGGDSFSGSLTRIAGENVGIYAINQGTLALNSNYTVNYMAADFTIGAKPITVTADAKTKTYGDADPGLTYTFVPALVAGDSFSGSLTRIAGENVGTYAISQGTLALNSNYTVTYMAADFTIGAKPIAVTADAKSKTYGDADPALTYTFAPALVGGDSFSGSLTRTAGENVGIYAINQGTLALNSNYTVNYMAADFTIGAKPITVTADAKTKTYGDADPALTYTFAPALVAGDSFSGSLTRTAGENVGIYAINKGTLALNSNYTVTYVGADFTIGAKPIAVTADAKSKTYGDADPALTYTFAPALVAGDSFSGSLTRTAGENVGTYAITQGTLALNSNYTVTYMGADFTIGAKTITVTADAKSKTYGDADPALTYTFAPALVTGDSFSGSLTRTAGENVGTYAITQGTLALNSNYTVTYMAADFTIAAKPITVTADAKSKTYGDADPALTYTFAPALVTGDSFSGSLTRTAGENVGTYTITQGTLSAGTNYTIRFITNDFTIVKANQTITWNQTLAFGCEGESTVILTATSSSKLPVSYTSSNSSLASISGNVLNVENYGSVNIIATQPGDNNYNAAAAISLPLVRSQPNLIRQQFENVIFFDNSSKSFSSYTWYKNGILVTGQTNQYYKEDGPLNGTYHAVAIRLDGTSVTTCPIVLSPTMEQQYIKIVPNPVKPNASYELLNNVPASLLQNARVQVYNITGQLMEDKTISQKTETLQAPNVEGIYIVRMTLTNGKYFSKNLLVKN